MVVPCHPHFVHVPHIGDFIDSAALAVIAIVGQQYGFWPYPNLIFIVRKTLHHDGVCRDTILINGDGFPVKIAREDLRVLGVKRRRDKNQFGENWLTSEFNRHHEG